MLIQAFEKIGASSCGSLKVIFEMTNWSFRSRKVKVSIFSSVMDFALAHDICIV